MEESNSQATSYTSCRFHIFNKTHRSSLSFCNGCILAFLYSYIYCRKRSFFKSPNAWLIFEVSFSCEAIWSEVYRAKHRGLCWFETRAVFLHKLRVTSFEGKRYIDTPGVWLELVQLSNPGPPATQYFPDTQRFRTSAISLNNLHN